MIALDERVLVRFWSKVRPSDDQGCWLWLAAINEHGYGMFSVGGRAGRMELAHRVSWRLINGPVPPGLQVLHRCDNPRCVSPEHLFLGNPRDNSDDKVSKRRHAFGQRNGEAKLTDEQVRRIRELYETTGTTQRQLAARFGVAQSTISDIVGRRKWRHL